MSSAAMHIARTGLDAQDMRMRVISNNLANVNTTGFKKDRAAFETLAYQTITTPGAQSTAETKYATGLNLGTGVRIQGTARMDTQGAMQTTGNSLDLALDGDGYFQVQMPGGTLGLHPRRQFLALRGRPAGHQRRLSGAARHHRARGDDRDHDRLATAPCRRPSPGQTEASQIGQIQVANFPNGAGLQATGDNYLVETAASGAANVGVAGQDGRGNIKQGMLEASNVNVVEELVDMIEDAARVRGQFEDDLGDRRHAQIRQPEHLIMTRKASTSLIATRRVRSSPGSSVRLSADASIFGKKAPPEDFSVARPLPVQPVPVVATGSIFQAQDGYAALYEGWRARKVGDPLTIVLVERTAASKSSGSKLDSSGSGTITPPTTGLAQPVQQDRRYAQRRSDLQRDGGRRPGELAVG